MGEANTQPGYTYRKTVAVGAFFLIYCIPSLAVVVVGETLGVRRALAVAVGIGGYAILFFTLVYIVPAMLKWRGHGRTSLHWKCAAVDASPGASLLNVFWAMSKAPIESINVRMALALVLAIAAFAGMLWVRKRRFGEICRWPPG
jgi:hypothetical protein